MQDFYKILELNPDATIEEIKASYRSLSKEYHPDKLPPGTPKKALKHVEDKFKEINEAYSVLSDTEKKERYDFELSNNRNSSSDLSNTSGPIFDPEKLREVAERLERLKQKIEKEYQENKREIDKSVKQQIEALGYTEKDLNNGELKGNTFSGKIIQCVIFGLIAWIGLWLMGLGNTFFWLIGICWSGFWLLGVIASVFTPTLNQKHVEKVREINNKGNADKIQAEKKQQNDLDYIIRHKEERIEFFKCIPVETLTEKYINNLSDEDQFYLLEAIKNRHDAEQITKNLTTAIGVVVGLGILAAIFNFWD